VPEYIYLIRHGQSTFNALFDLNRVDPLHFDARLSQIGIEQVAAARQAASAIPVELVVVSPLTRAIQTAVGLFGEATVPIIVTDLHRDDRGVAVEPDHLFAQRVTDFSRWLRARPEDVVVVVGHGEFLRRLSGRYLRNCEIMEWRP
jgi:glucosyl-3-phosphoglycerate phosphatase